MKLDAFCEKPTAEYAKEYLNSTRKHQKDNYYAVFGKYVLTDSVFKALEDDIANNRLSGGEIQLTAALDRVRSESGMMGLLIDGSSYDIGLPEKYRETLSSY
jgi:UTP--glucose-1-phosphate uridylyltransferase